MIKKININDPQAWRDLDWDEPAQPDLLKKTDQKVAVGRANRLTKTTKEFREKTAAKNQALAQDPKWLKSNAKKNQAMAKDPKWLEANRLGAVKRGDAQRGKTRKPHASASRELMSESASARWAKKMRKVYAEGKEYLSIYEASAALGIHKDTVVYRIKARPKEYYYI